MSNLTRLAFSSLSSNKRPGVAYSSSYSAAAALCNSRKEPSPPSKQQARAEASASLPRPAEIPWQPKIANSVRLIGLVGMPVHLEAAPDGNYWAATVLVRQKSNDSPRVRIPLLFEGDLAQIAACHLKEKDLICVTGQLSGDPPTLPFENSRAKNQVIVKKTNHVQMLKTQLEVVVKNVGYVKIINRQSPTLTSRYQRFTSGKDKKSDPVNMTSWEDLIANPKQWWDCRTAKINGMFDAKHPDFEHKSSGRCLWISRAPAWVLTKVCELEFEKVKVNPQQ